MIPRFLEIIVFEFSKLEHDPLSIMFHFLELRHDSAIFRNNRVRVLQTRARFVVYHVRVFETETRLVVVQLKVAIYKAMKLSKSKTASDLSEVFLRTSYRTVTRLHNNTVFFLVKI